MAFQKKKWFRLTAAVLAGALILQITGCAAAAKYLNTAVSSGLAELSSSPSVQFDSSTSSTPVSSRTASGTPAASSRKSGVQSVKKVAANAGDAGGRYENVPKSGVGSSNYSFLSQRGGYQGLTDGTERNLYQLIGQSAGQISNQKDSAGYYPVRRVSVSGSVSEAKIRLALMAYLNDNPQVFWVANAYSYGVSGAGTTLQMYSYLSPGDCGAAVKNLNSRLQAAVKSIPGGLNQFSREESAFDYLVARCSYDDAAAADASQWQAYTAYGALVNGKAVCEGYSRAMQLLSSYAGLSCILIRGTGDGVNHMWNEINIDGQWYNLDVTWCDSNMLIYNYFNVTDSVLSQTHQAGPLASSLSESAVCGSNSQYNLLLPECTSSSANYFVVRGAPVTAIGSSGDSAVEQAVAARLKAGDTTIPFRISPSLNYDSTVSQMMTDAPYKMWTYLEKASALSGRKLNLQQTTYATDKADRGINVQVTYQ